MEFPKLPPINKDKFLDLPHFPDRFHAAVFRLWETASAESIARALDTSKEIVINTAFSMGLPPQKHIEKFETRGYITTIRNAWHILPYEQLLRLLDWSEDKLANALKEEDFLIVKLGKFKPYCPPVCYKELNKEQKIRLEKIKNIVAEQVSNLFDGAIPFDFFDDIKESTKSPANSGIRMIYSYCGLYANVLDEDISLSYPDALLKMYSDNGINAIWLPAVLYQLVPFPFDESYSIGYEKRQERLRELIAKSKKYGIKVFLYLNEPRCMPLDFFEKYPELRGMSNDSYAALCSSDPRTTEYLRYAIRTLCRSVRDIGGFFTITLSENLTHCRSHMNDTPCPVCRDMPISKLVSNVINAIYEESTAVDKNIKNIAWTWSWDDFMTREEITECIDSIPKDVIIQCNSEAQKEFTIGGVSDRIRDYSMSIPGPSELAKFIWNYAKEKGHKVSAKVQVNVTWECSTLPYLPVFDLIREHMSGLRAECVDHIMLSWTLGGYPSINLKIATDCLDDPSYERYQSLLAAEFGEYATDVECAAKIFSEAFREFPFHIKSLYRGPQNGGPSNLLFPTPSGFKATMTCYAFDDLDSWRAIYPEEVYINQLKLLSEKWKVGLDLIQHMPDCQFKQMAEGGYALFHASYMQARFISERNSGNTKNLAAIAEEERKTALLFYSLMSRNSLFGYEAANHYYFNKGMLAEKLLNCEYIKEIFS